MRFVLFYSCYDLHHITEKLSAQWHLVHQQAATIQIWESRIIELQAIGAHFPCRSYIIKIGQCGMTRGVSPSIGPLSLTSNVTSVKWGHRDNPDDFNQAFCLHVAEIHDIPLVHRAVAFYSARNVVT